MLIIGDSNNCAVEYDKRNTKIKYINNNGLAELRINGVVFASSENHLAIHILFSRLMVYCGRYRRKDDSFDMRRELKIIYKEIENGKYIDYNKDLSKPNKDVGYPTYTS